MRAVLSGIGLISYFAICVALFVIWAPRFFYLNVDLPAQFTLEYVAVSGLAFAVFMVSVIAAQSVSPKFSAWLVLEVVIVAISFWFCIYTFDFKDQSDLFAFIHIVACGLFLFMNMRSYFKLSSSDSDD
ncbi:hypothetical protein [uncultured Abyssibacter sp.]|uniref:hypothetical protein n=1 Tax=uncultured Abyssibacter sp. TaxID=2320202 RepID=UPI0032B13641